MQRFMSRLRVSARSFFIALIIVLFATFDALQAKDIITGAGDGSTHVKSFDGQSQSIQASFFAYPPSFTGGVRVAAGDVNGDGTADIVTGAGPGATPHVKVFDGRTSAELDSFFAYGVGFAGGVYVASGDVNGDTVYDIVTGAGGGGGGHVKVFDGASGSEFKSFFAFAGGTDAEVRVAAGDVNGDGYADIIAGRSDLSHVRVFDGNSGINSELMSFDAYPGLTGGVHVAAGDIDGDGFSDIITGAGAGAGGMPHVKVFSGVTGSEIRSFFAYPSALSELRVAAGDVDGDGRDDIITAPGPGAGPHVKAFSGRDNSTLESFFAYDGGFMGGVYVAGIRVPEPTSLTLMAIAIALIPRRRLRKNDSI